MNKPINANSKQPESGVRFGLRGWLTTIIGFVLGGAVGVALIAILNSGDNLALLYFEPFGGIAGAIWGALLGIIVGARRGK